MEESLTMQRLEKFLNGLADSSRRGSRKALEVIYNLCKTLKVKNHTNNMNDGVMNETESLSFEVLKSTFGEQDLFKDKTWLLSPRAFGLNRTQMKEIEVLGQASRVLGVQVNFGQRLHQLCTRYARSVLWPHTPSFRSADFDSVVLNGF